MASAPTFFIGEADLHGLVDGHLEPARRADTLRRLAASPADRARVEAWQGQNDLLKTAFAGVEREPLPVLLDLKAKPRLHCVPANDAPIMTPAPAAGPPAAQRRRLSATFATLAVIALGLGGAWAMLDATESDDPVDGAPLRGSVDATLASRSASAITKDAADVAAPGAAALPTTDIPDLRAAGFAFTGADTDPSGPASIVFRYRDKAADRVAVTVARSGSHDATQGALLRIGTAYSWHKGANAYAIAGTVRPGRLRALAVSLLKDDAQ